MSTETVLDVQGVKTHFTAKKNWLGQVQSKVYAVDGVSFELKEGETLGLVGESGCGKSTLGRSLLQLVRPTEGKVFFKGQNLCEMSAQQLRPLRQNFQMIFQDPYSSLNPRMTIEEILLEPYVIHGLGTRKNLQQKLRDLLDKVGLPEKALSRYPHEFSGGQRQRVGIARAIALNPAVIVADEPVSALDVSVQSQILNLMKDLREELKLGYVFIAHDLAVVEYISDRVAVMYLGKIVEIASAEDLYKSPLHPYTQALIAAIPRVDQPHRGRREVLRGDVPSPIQPPSGCHFHTRCPKATELCKAKRPELKKHSMQADHAVACHHVEI
ncbi:MAG: ABC transporter ATP-binding protein [Oligoflexales bacterium]